MRRAKDEFSQERRKAMTKITDTLIGEALVGEGNEIAHIDLVIGPKEGPVGQAFVSSLAFPRAGHTPLLAVLEPNLQPKPCTLIVNKVTIKGAEQAVLMFGPAQAAVAKAVMDCVAEGTIPQDEAEDVVLIVSVFIHWQAKDKEKIYDYNYQATKLAVERAVAGEPTVDEALAKKDEAEHPFA
jgi:5,6,7,8-tetrahydromethanopterin hydro-lyase